MPDYRSHMMFIFRRPMRDLLRVRQEGGIGVEVGGVVGVACVIWRGKLKVGQLSGKF